MEKDPENIWYLAGPMFQYNEDVKALARQAGLKIIDANMAVGRANAAEDVPEVTIKAEYVEQGAIERVPTKDELLAIRDQLLERERELDDREQRLVDTKERIDALGAANEVEAERLRELAAVGATATGKPAFDAMTKDQLKSALTEMDIKYSSTADKAELVALLTTVA